MKETFPSLTLSTLQTQITLYTILCIEIPHTQTDIWIGTPTTLYICKKVCHTSTHPWGQDGMLHHRAFSQETRRWTTLTWLYGGAATNTAAQRCGLSVNPC